MDALLLANRLPKLAEAAMRHAILNLVCDGSVRVPRLAQRLLVDAALLSFEARVRRVAANGIRPALLFAERDRVVQELSRFARSRLATRLFAVRRRDLIALARAARPFDAVVRGPRGFYGVVFRRLAPGAGRLETVRAIRLAALAYGRCRLHGVVIYDLSSGKLQRLNDTGAQSPHRNLRSRPQLELPEDVRDVVLDRLVAEFEPQADLLVRDAFG
ncbi:MAG TPA: hypothetical protein VNG31_08300 [Candidatus Baltobacteraceae bacterium]|nr:hypothetical protein [Candidatus Baltobacteraceae bacterium]